MFVINRSVMTSGSKMDLFPGRMANASARVTPMDVPDGVSNLLIPAFATLMLAALALLLAMSERWPKAVATALMAVFLVLAAFVLTYGLKEDENELTFA